MEDAMRLPDGVGSIEDSAAARKPERVAVFSDPHALRFYLRLLSTLLIVVVMLLASIIGNFVQYFRGPVLAVGIQKPNGDIQWTSYNGSPVGNEDGSMKMMPDVIQPGDKTFYAGEFAKLLYAHDPSTRGKDVERALRMMMKESATKLIGCLNRGCEEYDLNLDHQRAEVWQTLWTEQSKDIDPNDAWTVHITGLQQTTKVVKGLSQKEAKQIQLSIKLVQDPLGRDVRNLRNGVQVESFTYKVISNGQ